MKRNVFFLISLFFFFSFSLKAQETKKIQWMSGFGLSINNEFFSISLQPGILYSFSPKIKTGMALQYSYAKSNKNYYGVNFKRNMYGGNLMAMYYPIKEIETSLEYEALRINETYNSVQKNYWSPGFFAGVGYMSKNFVVGFKFNFLYKEDGIYKEPLFPYVRIYF